MVLFTAPKFLQQDLSLITHRESGPIILTVCYRWKQVMFFGLTCMHSGNVADGFALPIRFRSLERTFHHDLQCITSLSGLSESRT
jgi:hypothetical protein